METPYLKINTTVGRKDVTIIKNKTGYTTYKFNDFDFLLTAKELERLWKLHKNIMNIDIKENM